MAEHGPVDALILGGGPAGLAAGVYLGRYLRPTIVLDHKKPQTRWYRPITHNVLGFPSGIHRNQLLDWGRLHVAKYECVKLVRTTVKTLAQRGSDGMFVLTDEHGASFIGKGLILATGVEHPLPDIPDIHHFAGHSIWHCPECDGYKCCGKSVAIIGTGNGTAEMALNTSVWADEIALCLHGQSADFSHEALEKLQAQNIRVYERRIVRILGDHEEGRLDGFELEDGQVVKAHGAFANGASLPPDDLLTQLPLEMHREHWVKVDYRQRTNIPRCYAAGDIVAHVQTQLSVAMGTGATAAIWLHKELLPDTLCLSGRQW